MSNFPTFKQHSAFLQLRNSLSALVILAPSQVIARLPLFGALVVYVLLRSRFISLTTSLVYF